MDERRSAPDQALINVPWLVSEETAGQVDVRPDGYRAKRWLDIALGSVALVLSAPLMALAAIAIKLDSRGPVLFVQERVGYDRLTRSPKPFRVYKFRTMLNNSDQNVHRAYVTGLITEDRAPAQPGASLKMSGDRRITRVGRWLRKTSLDELPQLVNVLRGEMSLVGPRPALPYEVAMYQAWQRQRLQALPGMTGWWQVAGRNRVTFDEMTRMDIYYVQHISLGFDLRILLSTPGAVLSTKGAG